MQRVKKAIAQNAWLLIVAGIPLALFLSLLQTILYTKFLLDIGKIGVRGQMYFEPVFIYPLVILDYFALIGLLWYDVLKKVLPLGFAVFFLLAHLAGIFFVLSYDIAQYDLSDFNVRVVVGTLPSLVLVGIYSAWILLDRRKKRLGFV